MTLPTIHLGGSSGRLLYAEYLKALDAAREAREAMSQIDFNARDYYVQGVDAWESALEERYTQMAGLDSLIEYLEQHLIHIDEQISNRS
jgi:hypothetical protein